MSDADAAQSQSDHFVSPRPALQRPPRQTWQWRPAILVRQQNRVEASGIGGLAVRLGTAFWGASADNLVRVGKGFSTLGIAIRVAGQGNRVEIGEGVRFSGRIVVHGFGLTVRIGDRCDVKRSEVVAYYADVGIGRDCLVAAGVSLRSGDFHTIIDRASGEQINGPEPVIVGDGVWISTKATLLKGAQVPNGCIIGWGSIVTRRFDEPDCIIAGSPARVVRQGIAWSR